jgi:hypothetical protein
MGIPEVWTLMTIPNTHVVHCEEGMISKHRQFQLMQT